MSRPLSTSRRALEAELAATRRSGSIALVPTMGALHPGHLSLIERARGEHDLVVVSIFVNPTQFTDPADFARYPRDLAADVSLAAAAGADVIFAPEVTEIYPEPDPGVAVDPGPLGETLEGASRPGHFRGVATVVAKLLGAVRPHAALFGEKDYQQLLVVRALTTALLLPVEVVACETVREPDGLAFSSRNVRLSAAERSAAPVLHGALLLGAAALAAGEAPAEAERAMAAMLAAEPLVTPDYAVVRDAATLGAPGGGAPRLLIAARVGTVRLIDNLAPGRARTLG